MSDLLPPLELVHDPQTRQQFARKLLRWFQRHQRELPWRQTDDLYRIWVSEIMLQQTQVATVIPYYQRFLEAFPHVVALADAPEQQVLAAWEGLGYYRRARQLHAAAAEIRDRHNGKFPESFKDVLALPGIGRYTAGAILSIGRDQPLPILEANTIRLFTRLLNDARDPTRSATQKTLWAFAENLLPARELGQFNQALMELGSQVCTPRQPACAACPVRDDCQAYREGDPESLPRRTRTMQYEEVEEAALIVRKRNRVLVRQCGEGERWSGLWDFPRFALGEAAAPPSKNSPRSEAPHPESPTSETPSSETPSSETPSSELLSSGPPSAPGRWRVQLAAQLASLTGIQAEIGATLTTLRHGVTRFRITLYCVEASYQGGRRRRDQAIEWMTVDAIRGLPLSVTGRKLVEIL